jgi:DNA (cytosine-5)-methyltransferase 1
VTLWLHRRNPAHHRRRKREGYRLDLDARPCPPVLAEGLDGDNHAHYWLEDDQMPGASDRQAAQRKPPYRIPLMAEIAAVPDSGYRLVSTFSGAGGSCLGFRMAGYRVLWASEFVPAARETYRANWPAVPVDARDIRTVTAAEILTRVGLAQGELDVLEGSPPCASFSTAGKREQGWGKVRAYSETAQQSDDLFFEYARLVEGIQPRVFVAENVAGLIKGVAKGYFQLILRRLRAAGYQVAARLLDAQWLGVPQQRQRLVFVGVRSDLGLPPAFPTPLRYRYSVRDALPHLAGYRFNTAGFTDRELEPGVDPAPTVAISGGGASWHHQVRGPRLELGAHGFYPGRVVDLDREPAPAVTASGLGSYRAELHDAPTPEEGEELVGHGNHTGADWRDVRPRQPDEPAATIGAHPGAGQGRRPAGEVEVLRGKPSSWVPTHDQQAPSLDGYSVGAEWDRLKPGKASDRYYNLSRPDPDRPSPTVTAVGGASGAGAPGGVASVTHPTERRKFTIAELRRICGFPDDFALTGSYAQQWERLGRAVPPPMMAAVAIAVRDQVLRKADGG